MLVSVIKDNKIKKFPNQETVSHIEQRLLRNFYKTLIRLNWKLVTKDIVQIFCYKFHENNCVSILIGHHFNPFHASCLFPYP